MYKLNEKGRKMFIEASDEKGYDTFLKQMFELQSLGEECPFSFKTSEILNSSFVSFEEADEKIKEDLMNNLVNHLVKNIKKDFFVILKS